jgi:hypothetical protein
MHKKILIVIAGYYERFQINTIESAIKRARHPENISFAISYHEDHNIDTSHISNKISRYVIPKGSKVGVAKPRSVLCQLKTDEDFVLLVDSHVIFMPDWDIEIIKDYEDRVSNAENKKIIISGSFGNSVPVSHLKYDVALEKYFNNNNFFNEKISSKIYEFYVDKGQYKSEEQVYPNYTELLRTRMPGMTHHVNVPEPEEGYPEKTCVFSAGFAFFPADWFDKYKLSQNIFFAGDQEEAGINIYTTGYDVWMPRYQYHIHMVDHKKASFQWIVFENKLWNAHIYIDVEKDLAGFNWFCNILKNTEYDDNIKRERSIKDFFDFHKLDLSIYK